MDPRLQKALDAIPPQTLQGRAKYYKGILYGEYGVGKTKLSGECAVAKGLVVATDTGTETFYNHPELLERIEVVPYEGLSQLTGIATAVTEGIEPWCEYDIIIVDTISQVQEEYLDFLNDNFTYSGNLREKATPTPAARSRGYKDQEVVGLPDYHLTRNNMRHPLKTLIKAPVNVMFLAHLREPGFLDKDRLTRRPTLTESVFKLIAREATFMGLMERDGKKRTIQFMTDKKTVSKSRIAELDDKIINADELPEILMKWSNK